MLHLLLENTTCIKIVQVPVFSSVDFLYTLLSIHYEQIIKQLFP